MTKIDQREAYADIGAAADARAARHARIACEVIQRDPEGPLVAVVHALLAVEARLEELTYHVAQTR